MRPDIFKIWAAWLLVTGEILSQPIHLGLLGRLLSAMARSSGGRGGPPVSAGCVCSSRRTLLNILSGGKEEAGGDCGCGYAPPAYSPPCRRTFFSGEKEKGESCGESYSLPSYQPSYSPPPPEYGAPCSCRRTFNIFSGEKEKPCNCAGYQAPSYTAPSYESPAPSYTASSYESPAPSYTAPSYESPAPCSCRRLFSLLSGAKEEDCDCGYFAPTPVSGYGSPCSNRRFFGIFSGKKENNEDENCIEAGYSPPSYKPSYGNPAQVISPASNFQPGLGLVLGLAGVSHDDHQASQSPACRTVLATVFEEQCTTRDVEKCVTVLENQCTTSTVCQENLSVETGVDIAAAEERSQEEEKCLTRSKVECSPVTRPVCVTLTKTEYVEECEDTPGSQPTCFTTEEEAECSTQLEEVCSTQVLGSGETVQTCSLQPRQTCTTIPVELCEAPPHRSCKNNPVEVEVEECEEVVEKEVCEEVEVEECGKCEPVPVTDCQQIPVESCSLRPEQICQQVPTLKHKQICQ